MPDRIAALRIFILLAAGFAGTGNVRAQIQFISDLEDLDMSCFSARPAAGCSGWTGIHDAAISLCRGEIAHSGSQSLKIDFKKNEDYGGTWRSANTRHIFTRFYDYYAPGFDFAAGMKIHRLSGFNDSKQINDFDIILQLKADDPASNYCGVTDAKYLAMSYNGGPVDWGSVEVRWTPERGRWYAMETEVKLNTPGSSDGEVRIFVDGRLMAEKTGMNLTGTLNTPINRVMFGGWYSNAAAGKNPCPDPVQESVRYVDDPAIANAYIGPMPAVTLGTLPRTRIVTWTLPQSGTFQAEYGKDAGYGSLAAAVATNGAYAAVLTGLDTNQACHFRLNGKWSSGAAYVSPDYVLSTAPGGVAPVGPRRPRHPPVNLRAHEYNPIPD